MKKMKVRDLSVLVFAMIFGFLTIIADNHVVSAQENPTTPRILGLDISPGELNEADLARFVELAFNEEITAAQAQSVYERLTDVQKGTVSNLVALQAGIPLEEWNREKEAYQRAFEEPLRQPAPSSIGELWRQPVENRWTSGYPQGYSFASYYYQDQWCETVYPTDPDIDWVFHFNMTYSANPDGLRWTSDSAQVYLAFMTSYQGKLNSFAYNWAQVKVCLGTNGVSAAGGASNVKNNVFLTPNN